MKRYAFVVPRFGEEIVGGAETLVGSLAANLIARGDDVLVLTTCARDNRTWENHYPAGMAHAFGVPCVRFPVSPRDLDRWVPLQIKIHEGREVSVDEQLEWMQESVNALELYGYLKQQASTFDAIFFAPYLFGTTFWGSLICPEKSVLIPCLHDESYAYLEIIGSMFRQVRGALFNAQPERNLAERLYGPIRGGVVGMGFELPPEGQRHPPVLAEGTDYIVYLGRKETGKNVHLLIDYFCEAKSAGLIPESLKLVVGGGGSFDDLHRPHARSRPDIVDLQHLSEEDKLRLLANALFLCQLSTNESFSIVLMEGWGVATPAVVHGGCAVTKHHVVESGGGLYVSSAEDLGAVTQTLMDDPALRAQLAANGRKYVETECSWRAVLARFDVAMKEFEGEGSRV